MNKKIVKDLLEKLKDKKIEFCILRNYENIEENKDVDILIKHNDARKVKKILKKIKLVKRFGGKGPFLLCDCRADIKIGCIDCDGRFYRKAKDVLKRKKSYKNFYILSEEDELEHLIVHSIVTKGNFKETYKRRIEKIIKKCDLKFVEKRLTSKFGEIGKDILKEVKNKNYNESLDYRECMQKKVRTLKNFIIYYFYRIHFFCKKKVME